MPATSGDDVEPFAAADAQGIEAEFLRSKNWSG
jgi:hypothetical protein